jgi:hypothetical protein
MYPTENLYTGSHYALYGFFGFIVIVGFAILLHFNTRSILRHTYKESHELNTADSVSVVAFLALTSAYVFLTITAGKAYSTDDLAGLVTRKFGFLILVVGLAYLAFVGKVYGSRNFQDYKAKQLHKEEERTQAYKETLDRYNEKLGAKGSD